MLAVTCPGSIAMFSGYSRPRRKAKIGRMSPGHLLSFLDKIIYSAATAAIKRKTTNRWIIRYTFL